MSPLSLYHNTPAEVPLSIDDTDNSPALEERQRVDWLRDDSLVVSPLFGQGVTNIVVFFDLFTSFEVERFFLLRKFSKLCNCVEVLSEDVGQ